MSSIIWLGFIGLILVLLAVDLGVLNRRPHVLSVREALKWTGLWVIVALLFNVALYFIYRHDWMGIASASPEHLDGSTAALTYFSGWLTEYSLSIDNIFVIALIFNYFRVAREHQHRVLFWGILGALVMRGAMIFAGTALISRYHWVIYVFGVVLFISAIRLMFAGDDEKFEPDKNWLVRIARKLFPVSTTYEGQRFFTRQDGRLAMTPLFLVLLVVESTDVVFAVDSIPAIFGITYDPFIVFTSNVFAILGLRSLFFALAGLMDQFKYLKSSLVFVLVFISVKMLVSGYYEIPDGAALAVILGILVAGVMASVLTARRHAAKLAEEARGEKS